MKTLLHNRPLSVALLLLAIASIALAVSVGSRTSAASAADATAAPAWLASNASTVAASFGGSSAGIASSTWVKTTWGQYVKAVGSNGDASSDKPAYVVVLHGDFSSTAPISASGAAHTVQGKVLVLAYDATTQELSNMDVLYSSAGITESSLGQPTALPLSIQ